MPLGRPVCTKAVCRVLQGMMGTTGGKVEGGQFLQGKCSSFVIWGSVPLFGGSAAIADRCLALRISRGLVTPPVLVSGRPQALLTRSPTGGFSGPLLDGWHLPAGGPHGGRPHGWVGDCRVGRAIAVPPPSSTQTAGVIIR